LEAENNQRRRNTRNQKKNIEQDKNDALEAELNIPPELRAIIDDPESDEDKSMPLRFSDPNELMEIFSTLEM